MEQVLSVTKSKLDDILDLKLLEEYINQLYKCIQVPITLLDINGEIIFASRWIELCETYIRKDLRLGTTCKEICSKIGEYGPGIFTCPNGLMMYRIPIQVKNGTIAYLVLSQFLMEGTEENYVVDVLRHS